LKHFEIAVKKDPHNGLYLNNRAIVKSRLDKLEEAIADYSKVIDMDSAD
jgi:tetratricopeptide (TPR) repeat protein